MPSSLAAVQWAPAEPWKLEQISVDQPGPGEVLVRVAAAGVCHSDDHLTRGGHPGMPRPLIGGHEGAGVVETVGDGVTSLRPDDHVVFSVTAASCGHCHACLRGLPYLCEQGARAARPSKLAERTGRHHIDDVDLNPFIGLGTFAQYTIVTEHRAVRVDKDIPLEHACVAGCAALTGWGAAINSAEVRAGDAVVVVGAGGIGACAIQGSVAAGADWVMAVDPVPYKREMAKRFGAAYTATSMDESYEQIHELTRGRMADKLLMCVGLGSGAMLNGAAGLVGKRGRVVIVSVHPDDENQVSLSLRQLQIYEKQIVGCQAGSWPAGRAIPYLMSMYRQGRLDLASLVSVSYPLADFDAAFADQARGTSIRCVLTTA